MTTKFKCVDQGWGFDLIIQLLNHLIRHHVQSFNEIMYAFRNDVNRPVLVIWMSRGAQNIDIGGDYNIANYNSTILKLVHKYF